MLYISDVQQLVSGWTDRLSSPVHPLDYKTALSECVFELSNLINKSISEELDYQDMLESWAADSFNSSSEAHELRAA